MAGILESLLERILNAIRSGNEERAMPGRSLPSIGSAVSSAANNAAKMTTKTVKNLGDTGNLGNATLGALEELGPTMRNLVGVIKQLDSTFSQNFDFMQSSPRERVRQMAVQAAQRGIVLDDSRLAQLFQQMQRIGQRELAANRAVDRVTRQEDLLSGTIADVTGFDFQKWYMETLNQGRDMYYQNHPGVRRQDERLQSYTENDPMTRNFIKSKQQAQMNRDINRNDRMGDE